MLSRGELLRAVAPPIFLNILLFLFVGWAFIHTIGRWTTVSLGEEWYAVLLSIIFAILIVAVLVFVFMAVFVALTSIIGAPFYDLLADRIMKRSGHVVERNVWQDIGFSFKVEIRKVVLFGLIQAALLFLHLLPAVGQVTYAVLGFLVTTYFLAYSYLDYAFSRTEMGLAKRINWTRKHPLEVFGFGFAVFIAFLVPVLNAIIIPAAVVGGIKLYRDLESN